uniref:Uncharacterized protein MANES_02G113800 n=1 Tax=Rhizophora mucronata TaxID=61149 RepID=A0A2P2K3F4_RHIMU
MMTGLRAFDTRRPDGQQNLVDWLKPKLSHKRKLKTIMDRRMDGQYSSKAMLQAAEITLKCLESDPRSRPHMKEVVEVLEQIEMIKDKPGGSKSSSRSTHSSSASHRGDQQQRAHNRSPLHSKAA